LSPESSRIQLLLTEAAWTRIRPRLGQYGLDIVTVTPSLEFRRDGRALARDLVRPDVVWTSLDCVEAGQLDAVVDRAIHGGRTQWIQLFGAGVDGAIFSTIATSGARLTKTNAPSVSIAEYVVTHAISLIVPVEEQHRLQLAKTWKVTPYREISQTRWTIIGYGAVGYEVTRRVKSFGARVTIVRRTAAPAGIADDCVAADRMTRALSDADVVVLACPLTEETRNIANAGFFGAMKPGAIFINIGRGGLVDEEALRHGLDRNQPGRAVLDVFNEEPLPEDNWLWTHPKVRVTAHTSFSGEGTLLRGDSFFLENLDRFLAGEPLLREVAPHEISRDS